MLQNSPTLIGGRGSTHLAKGVIAMARTGLFWVIAKEEDDIMCGDFKMIASFNYCGSNKYINQKQAWQELTKTRPQLQRYAFWYFPRGRVESFKTGNKTSYRLTISKSLGNPTVIEKVRSTFGLIYEHFKIHKDSTGEYNCIFDQFDFDTE